MKTAKPIFISALLAFGLLQGPSASADIVACDSSEMKTCWRFDSIDSVGVRGNFLIPGQSLMVRGKVGGAVRTVNLYLPTAKDPVYISMLENCQKLALLAQASPEKLKFEVDLQTEFDNEAFVSSDFTQSMVNCRVTSDNGLARIPPALKPKLEISQ